MTQPIVTVDTIKKVGIDEDGRLWVEPMREQFPFIYREAMDVSWDLAKKRLYSPRPREWTYANWFERIRKAAREQGVDLVLDYSTTWLGVDDNLRAALVAVG